MIGVMILLGLIQGLTEFLPVSSSGHLVLMYKLFGIESDNLLLSILLHVATLLSIVVVYHRDIWQLIRHPFCKTNICLLFATIPTVVIVLIFNKFISASFGGSTLVFGFLITAIMLVVADYLSQKRNFVSQSNDITNVNIKWWQGVIIGIVQGIACVPGISRSGSTIGSALITGVDKKTATSFSFIMSIPVIIGSLIWEIISDGGIVLSVNVVGVVLGVVVAFVVGVLAIRFMQKLVAGSKLYYFSYYLMILTAIIVVFNLV